ncbi:MAG: Eco57I restriction-modification methylase domain-containing protein [Candidatus Sumerlaeota bacterium]|nr:Eco57I restriction-modification methylase domain-containing protein [Candidatus Sumerlaeota bacterium]
MPVEILGTVYERFLGKVIRLTAGHQAKVEEKPEVRKAGGVYYTPSYIVEYIVRNTVGKQIEGQSPAQLAGSKNKPPFRILDMACGSGSFLLGAYQCLQDHCLRWYIEHNPETNKKAVYQDPRHGQWRLTIEEKKRILTTHIFGVDIDPQAVEVTKLSLLLKALEGEDNASLSRQLELFRARALPNLADNIKCGNSLIGPDYFTGGLIYDPEEMKRVNPFDWRQGFPDAMEAGGFDCIIGNPPYIRIQTMKEWAPLEVEIYKELFHAGSAGNYDIYVVFIEQGLKLLNAKGSLGFICPHKFFNSKYGSPLRGIIAKGQHLSHVVHFADQQIFAGATTYTCMLFLEKAGAQECWFRLADEIEKWKATQSARDAFIPARNITDKEWNFQPGDGVRLFRKLQRMPVKLGDVASIFVGLQTSADPVFVFKDVLSLKGRTVSVYSKQLDEIISIETDLLKPVVRSGNIGRYFADATAAVLFPYEFDNGKAKLIPENVLKKTFPKAWSYLLRNKHLLAEREHGKFKTTGWYQLYPKNLDLWEQPKILVPYMSTRLNACFDTDNRYFVNVTTGGFGVTISWRHGDMRYFTGLLNSRLLNWMMKKVSTKFHGGYFGANKQFLVQLAIRAVNLNDYRDKTAHDRMVTLVDSMLTLHKHFASAKSEAQKEIIQRQIAATDAEIDRLVYELYGLTDEEIAIIEGD